MKRTTTKPVARWAIPILASAVVLLALAPPLMAGQGDAANPRVLPPQSESYGMSYGEWSVLWWQWAWSIPEPDNPVIDATGEDAAVGQSGPVFFLAGTFGGPAERTITVPAGKALFFPLINATWDNVSWDTPPFNDPLWSVEELYVMIAEFVESVYDLHCSVDGVPIENLFEYRAISPPFSYTLPEGEDVYEWLGYTAATGYDLSGVTVDPAVSDGYWLMLAPLPPGDHEIVFGGSGIYFGWEFTVDITYHITVVPGGK